MSIRRVILKTAPGLRGDQDRGDAAAALIHRQAAAGMIPLPLIPCQDNQIGLASLIQGRKQFVHQNFQPRVSDIKGAVVSIIAKIWGDESKIGKYTCRQVCGKSRKRDDATITALRVQPNWQKINERTALHAMCLAGTGLSITV